MILRGNLDNLNFRAPWLNFWYYIVLQYNHIPKKTNPNQNSKLIFPHTILYKKSLGLYLYTTYKLTMLLSGYINYTNLCLWFFCPSSLIPIYILMIYLTTVPANLRFHLCSKTTLVLPLQKWWCHVCVQTWEDDDPWNILSVLFSLQHWRGQRNIPVFHRTELVLHVRPIFSYSWKKNSYVHLEHETFILISVLT